MERRPRCSSVDVPLYVFLRCALPPHTLFLRNPNLGQCVAEELDKVNGIADHIWTTAWP